MSITNNNPFLLNIQPVQGSLANATGLDPITTLRSDVDDIQQMVKFGEKRIAVDVISAYNQTKIQVINDINVQNSILSINDIPVGTGGNNNNIINNDSFISVSTSLSYGLFGISSLSSIVSYGLSTLNAEHGISSLSSIVAYGLSTVALQPHNGVSSLSSIVSYGLSTVYRSIETLAGFSNLLNPGVSSLSSIVAYGLSTVYRSIENLAGFSNSLNPGVSSLSSIVAYGLSSLHSPTGVSSLSSIISYGLSSVLSPDTQYLGRNNWVAGFYPSSIGGADIYDSNTGNPDTYTLALAKLDAWIYKNIVDQPIAPSYFGKSNSVSTINYYWTNPQQFKIGILNIFSPYISSLNMNLYSNATLFSTFTYSDPYLENSRFTVEGVEFISAESNSPISIYQNPSFSNKNTVRIPIDNYTFNINNGPYSLELYFRNYSSNIEKKLNFGTNSLDFIGIPEPPQSFLFTNIGLSNAFMQIQKPNLHSINPNLLNYPRLNYQVTLCNIAPPSRRYRPTASGFTPSLIFEESNYSYIAPLQSNSLNNILNADSTYIATIKVRNIINQGYSGQLISPQFTTLLPNPPGTLTGITALSNGVTNTQSVFGNISNVLVYNRNIFGVGGLQFTTNSGLGIQSLSNPGSSGTSIASISLIVTGSTGAVDTNTLNLNGFADVITATTSNSNANTIITAQNIRDLYTGDSIQSNFFMSFTANATLRQSYLTGSSNLYRISIRHSNTGFNCNFTYSNFYIDDLAIGAPSLINVNILSNSVRYNSGVPSYFNQTVNENGVTYANSVLFNFQLSNLARYFFIRNQSLLTGSIRYKGSDLYYINNTCNNTLLYTEQNTIQNRAPLSNISIIKHAFSIPPNIFTEANSNGSRLSVNVSLSNLNGISNIVERRLPFYIDMLSINNNTNPPMDRTVNGALRGFGYDNNTLIIDNIVSDTWYNTELPYVGGLYRTGAALSNLYDSFSNFEVPSGSPNNAYTRLNNYSNIKNENINRSVSFLKYYNSPNTNVYINKVTINFSNQSGLVLINSNYNNLIVTDFIGFIMSGPYSVDISYNINTIRSNISPFSGNHGTRPDCNITSNSRTISIPPYNGSTDRRFGIEIALRMNCNVSFQNINVVFGSNFAPPSPANVSLTNSANNLTLNWQTPANCNSPLDNYTFNIIPSCNSTHPRRWVQSGSRIIQEAYFSNVICNVFVPDTSQLYPFTTYQYTGTALNYDTPYTGQVSLTNDATRSAFSNSTSITTPLPSNTLSNFSAASNLDLNPANKTYYPFSSGFNICSRRFVTNILSNNGQTVFIDYLINGSISNAFSINNSNNTGPRLSNYSYTARWFNEGLAQASAITIFQFSNELYSNILTSTTRSSPTSNGLTIQVNQIQDVYNSGLATGFYLKAYVNIKADNFNGTLHSNYFTLSNSDGLLLRSPDLYIENITGLPIISQVMIPYAEFESPVSCEYICGINVWDSYRRLRFVAGVLNLARFYFRSNCISWKVMERINSDTVIQQFNFNNASTPFYINPRTTLFVNLQPYYCTGNIDYQLNLLSDRSVYFTWDILLNYDVYTPFNIPVFKITAHNLLGSSQEITTRFGYRDINDGIANGHASVLISGINIFIDSYSIRVKNNTLNSNWSPGACNYGIRVESGAGLYPTIFGSNFNHSNNLITTYSNELQLGYGAYRTYSNGRLPIGINDMFFVDITARKAYLNYTLYHDYFSPISAPNYETIPSEGIRYVTFKWFINSNISRQWRSANIAFDFDDAPFTYDSTTFVFPGIDVHYKIIASNDSTPTPTNLTTAWLNANALSSSVPTNIQKNSNGHPSGFYYIGTASDTNNLKVYFPSGNYSNVPFNFFVRIGMPMNSNVSLKYCRLSLDTGGVVPGQQQNFSITNAALLSSANALANTTISWTSQNDGVQIDRFNITYTAISNGIYPRRYRPSGTVITDSSNITSNVSIAGVATTSTYLFTPSNYDTFYYGSVIANNATGSSILTSNISVGPTALPANTSEFFSANLIPITTVNYTRNGILFANRLGGSIENTLIYKSNLLFTQGGSVTFRTIENIRINDPDININAIGNLNLVTWNVSLSNLTANTPIKNCNYTFSNEIFNVPEQTIVPVNDGSINWTLLSVRDIYYGNIYASGFYAKATPEIKLSNTIIPPSSNLYRLLIKNLYNSLTNFKDFYVENLVGAPSGTLFVENIGGINFCNISGVSVITSTTFNFWIATSNIGSFFFYDPPVSASIINMSPPSFQFNSNTTPFYWNCNSTATYTRSPISNTTYFYWSNVTATTTFGTVYTFTGMVNNMDTIGVSLIGSFTPYFDFESVTNMNCNLRVSSGTDSIPEYADGFGLSFNNNTSIVSTNELQFVKGVYCTKTYAPTGFTSTSVYQNYANYFTPQNGFRPTYTSIGTGGKRYVSFLFSNVNPNNTSNKLDTVILRFVYINDGIAPTSGNLYQVSTTFQVRLNNNSPSISTDSTAWLNANSIGAPTLITKNTNGTSCLTRTFESSTDGTNTYYNCFIQIPPGCGYCNMNLYTRVGFDMSAGIALRRIELSSNTVINIPSQFNATLYINSNGARFDINLLPNLPIAIYCDLSTNFTINSEIFTPFPTQAITSVSNYTFTNSSFTSSETNIINRFAFGTFVITNNLGTTFYTSNTIQSIDYLVGRPFAVYITFSNPGVWSSSSNYIVSRIRGVRYPTTSITYYTISNDNNSFNSTGNFNNIVDANSQYIFSNFLTSDQYLNRAFYMTTYVQATMRDGSTRQSDNLIAAPNGILSPPTGYSNSTAVVSFNSATGLTLLTSSNFYNNNQIFTLSLCNANYGFQSFSNAGFPRSIYGYCNDPNSRDPFISPNVSNAPITFPFVASNNFSVYDTFYNAYLYLVFSNGASTCNTSNFISTAKTGLPPDTRSNWSGASLSFTGTAFPHKGVIGSTQVDVFQTGSLITLIGASNIRVNASGNPGFVSGCNYNLQITYPGGSYPYTFSDSDYSGRTNTIGGDANKQLITQDYTSCNYAKGFYLSFNLNYRHTYNSASATANSHTFSLNGVQGPTDIRYIDASGGQITVSIGSGNYNSNVRASCPVSVTNLGNRDLTFTNTYNEIKPFIFGNLSFRYNSCNRPSFISNNLVQDYSSIAAQSFGPVNRNINNTILGVVINGCNSIVNYTMSASYSNLATTCNTSVSDSVFNDATDPTTNSNLTLSNGNLKWILGAWRADYTNLNFNSTALQGTFGNSGFVLGPGILQYLYTPFSEPGVEYAFFTLNTTQTPTSIIAYFPQDPSNPGNGYGTFNCLLGGGPPSTTNHGDDPDTNGILVGKVGNRYQIGVPTGFSTGFFFLWLTINSGSLSNIINS